jgi:hypothetical protein
MALILIIDSIVQSNDGTTLTITDGTGLYDVTTNPNGWGTPNTALANIDGTTADLQLQINYTDSSLVQTVYDVIDYYTLNLAAPTTIADLVFSITSADLKVSGVAIGTATDKLPDGWYDIEYSISKDEVGGTGSFSSTISYKLCLGTVRNSIYTYYLSIPYHNILAIKSKLYTPNLLDLTYPVYLVSLFEGINANITESRKNHILEELNELERLITV